MNENEVHFQAVYMAIAAKLATANDEIANLMGTIAVLRHQLEDRDKTIANLKAALAIDEAKNKGEGDA